MAAAVKFDDGLGFASNCFPVRRPFNSNASAEPDGAWVVAHKAEQKRRFRAILCSQPKTYSQIKEERRRAEKVEKLLAVKGAEQVNIVHDEDEEPVLDGFFLLRRCCVDDPTDVCSVSITGLGISEAKTEDFALFDNVAYVNASENFLPLETFAAFPIIRELEMPLNALRSLKITRADFPELEILDLSYNNLSHDDLLSLGLLPKLRVLHLTGNGFTSLPDAMAKPCIHDDWYKTPRYPSLEILMLDDNQLTEAGSFSALAGLKRLKVLSLSKNDIEYVPHLQLVDNNKRIQESRAGPRPRSGRRPRSARKTPRSARSRKRDDQVNEDSADNPKVSKTEIEAAINEALADQADDLPDPFNQLRCIDLSHNKISEDESVLPVALWPMLSEVIIHDNPLTTRRTGPPPMLQRLLVDRCGIELIRKKPDPISKPPVEVTFKAERKIHSAVPKVPKIPVDTLLAIEAPKLSQTSPKPAEAVKSTEPDEEDGHDPRGGSRESRQVRESMDYRPAESRTMSRDSARNVTFANNHDDSGASGGGARNDDRSNASAPSDGRKTRTPVEVKSASKAGSPREESEQGKEPVTSHDDVTAETGPDTKEGAAPDVDPVFLTQVQDGPEEPDDVTGHVPRPPTNEKQDRTTPPRRVRRTVVPDKYKGYEALLPDEDERGNSPLQERDIHTCVRALKYALNHPVTVKPMKGPLDKPVPEFKPYQKTGELPPPPVHKTRPQRVDSALRKIKHRAVVTEAPLKEALDDTDEVSSKFPEAPKLLSEVQMKYNSVRINSLQEAEQLHSMVQSVVKENSPNKKPLKSSSTQSSVR